MLWISAHAHAGAANDPTPIMFMAIQLLGIWL